MADADLSGRRVLLVEDEYLVAGDVAEALEDAGAEVIGPAPSVEQALALIEGAPGLHVAVLDVNLGGEPVYPVADALAGRGVPFVFVTGYDAGTIPPHYRDVPRLMKPVGAAAVVREAARSAGS